MSEPCATAFSTASRRCRPTPTTRNAHVRSLTAEGKYEYYQPIRAEGGSCLTICHTAPLGGSGIDNIGTGMSLNSRVSNIPLAKGDIMAIAKVTIPTTRHAAQDQ